MESRKTVLMNLFVGQQCSVVKKLPAKQETQV